MNFGSSLDSGEMMRDDEIGEALHRFRMQELQPPHCESSAACLGVKGEFPQLTIPSKASGAVDGSTNENWRVWGGVGGVC